MSNNVLVKAVKSLQFNNPKRQTISETTRQLLREKLTKTVSVRDYSNSESPMSVAESTPTEYTKPETPMSVTETTPPEVTTDNQQEHELNVSTEQNYTINPTTETYAATQQIPQTLEQSCNERWWYSSIMISIMQFHHSA